jgi:S-adenosylmethionine uptake transporter
VVFYFSFGGVLAGALLALLTGGFHAHDLRGLLLLLAIGLLATGAQWMMTRAYSVGATLGIASLQYLGIVFSVLLGVLLFNDKVSALAILGMVLIVAAGVSANFLRSRVVSVRR